METHPIYVLAAGNGHQRRSSRPPLGLFPSADAMSWCACIESEYGIARRRLTGICSPWATKRLDEFGGDISKFVGR